MVDDTCDQKTKRTSTTDSPRKSNFSEELIEDKTIEDKTSLLASIVESSDDAIINKNLGRYHHLMEPRR
jgi:hypothetical protein